MKRRRYVTKKDEQQEGFTLIELSMSLVFIAFIILFLSSTLLSIMRTYNKGIWLSQINQAGRQINADISDQARFSKNKVVIDKSAQRFCIGDVTYIWNTIDSVKNRYSNEPVDSVSNKSTKLRFARVLDGTGKYCRDSSSMPDRDNSNTSALLGSGIIVKELEVTEGKTGLVRVRAVFSTEGDDQAQKVDGHYRCGQVVGGVFKVGSNQFCAFAEFDIITYRRLGE